MIFNYAIIAFALSAAVNAIPQGYPNKCGDQICPADKPNCCEVIVNGLPTTTTSAFTNTTTPAPSTPTFGFK
ncbi:hypothetical protein BGZ63DRAFT_425656 [Mariannaea sp. PMI_226]|nr:hypothetical protein BGZ63DRAFT_425656 [Mariannaea sp. PMI_226]